MKKILFVVNTSVFFISHRLEIAKHAKDKGFEVHVASAYDQNSVQKIEREGFFYHEINFSRTGGNIFRELSTVMSLYTLFKMIKPDLVHLITIKPYLYGGIVARFVKVDCVVSAVAGLGILFSSKYIKYRLLRVFLYPFYRLAFSHKNQQVIFQNKDDCNILFNWGVVSQEKVVMIRGSGVDLDLYPYHPEPVGTPVISFAARLLIDKGVKVFIEASRILKSRKVKTRFRLIGDIDSGNSNSVTDKELNKWSDEGLIEVLGFREDIPHLFSDSNIVTLPSFYGEGLPKTLIEAAACGRAVITTDHPGCRDAIEANQTGLLIPIKNAVALADSIEYLIANPAIRNNLGVAGRNLAEREFNIENVVDKHIKIYNDLLFNVESLK
jgi:glycosyltransferase involved in cell wall biosynthesis